MLSLTSAAFGSRGEIPEPYTCNGENVSPPLSWLEVPEDAESLAVVLDDPDAPGGTFTHWILYNIPPVRTRLPGSFSPGLEEGGEMREGRNDFNHLRYEGPCPPVGDNAHHYHFRLYALDTKLNLPPGVTRDQFYDTIEGHILEESELVGTYRREAGI